MYTVYVDSWALEDGPLYLGSFESIEEAIFWLMEEEDWYEPDSNITIYDQQGNEINELYYDIG